MIQAGKGLLVTHLGMAVTLVSGAPLGRQKRTLERSCVLQGCGGRVSLKHSRRQVLDCLVGITEWDQGNETSYQPKIPEISGERLLPGCHPELHESSIQSSFLVGENSCWSRTSGPDPRSIQELDDMTEILSSLSDMTGLNSCNNNQVVLVVRNPVSL